MLQVPGESAMQLPAFIESSFLPAANQRLKASTIYGYGRLFYEHRDSLPDLPVTEIRTVHIEQMIEKVQAAKGLRKNSLHNLKSFLSGVFKYAVRTGVIDFNPVREVSLPRAQEAEETYAYSLSEVLAILQRLSGRAKAVVAVAAFTGLRKGEIAGLQWMDYSAGTIQVRRAKWMDSMDTPKTRRSKAPVPVIPPLAAILDAWRGEHYMRFNGSPWMFDSVPLDMDRFEDKELRMHIHDFPGWHSFRRGLATTLKRLGVEDVVIQAILRHSSVRVTQACYIKTNQADTTAAMNRLEMEIAR